MCGICGIIHTDTEKKVVPALVKEMCDVIYHRGPDDDGIYTRANVGIGMRRLSIIDLVTGKQPISNENGDMWIVFNGEIYNHQEIRKELQNRGHRFRTKTDTESIIHAYEEYGDRCVEKLNGMFAFAIWDDRKKRLFLARDRIGIKPLYYFFDRQRFVFGSEIKSILKAGNIPKTIDLQALDHFLTFEYIPAPLSIFKEIRKLPPGHTLTLTDLKNVNIRQYWDLPVENNGVDILEKREELFETLQDAVRIRLMSDVPLGAFLSGGVDSSTVVALMSQVLNQPVKTFSIGFEDQTYNELNYARLIAKKFNTEHHEFIIQANALELADKLLYYLDEPFGDFSIFPTYLVSKIAKDFVTVVLSGDGGDELFAGYDTYIADQLATRYAKIPRWLRNSFIHPIVDSIPPSPKKKGLINRTKRFVEGMKLPEDLHHARWMIFLQQIERELLYTNDVKSEILREDSYQFIRKYFRNVIPQTNDDINQQMYVDVKTYLVDNILVKVDRMSMATSLEARVPFLDHRVVELAATIPGEGKLQGRRSKIVLKQAMDKLLPREILYRGKEGFSIPIKNWIKNELKPMMLDILSRDRLKREGFFNPDFVEKLIKEHLDGKENHSHRLWALMIFGRWHEIYMD